MQTILLDVPFKDFPIPVKAKCCVKCGETKPFVHFFKNPDSRDGRRNDCKKCKYAKTYARKKERLATEEGYREACNDKLKIRYHTDEEFRLRRIQHANNYYYKSTT